MASGTGRPIHGAPAHASLSAKERAALGRARRERAPRSSHSVLDADLRQANPVDLLAEQAESRVAELVPVRHGRMLQSPFAFFRGAALIMAADLHRTPRSGLTVQVCGDAHLSNFGAFGSPERKLLFDINDFDETLPGPWEWDVKRLAASFEIAGRELGFDRHDRRSVVLAVAREYREGMRRAASMSTLGAWYAHMDIDDVLTWVSEEVRAKRLGRKEAKEAAQDVARARSRDSRRQFAKRIAEIDGQLRIVADPPLIVPIEDLVPAGSGRERSEQAMRALLGSYRKTLPHQPHPVEEYRFVHMARKVVGVGSVGTRAWIILMLGRDDGDPLFLQAKEAQPSVLERFVGRSRYRNHGRRVVAGQRLMQAASDIFLGWQRVTDVDGQTRDYYIRQLHDWKGGAEEDTFRVPGATLYGRMCGLTLARAHARSGDRIAIAAYLGKGDTFDRAIADFSSAYADRNERDFEAFAKAVSSGRLSAVTGL
jgi:uncharacterized protein (DUF2252 family)